MSKKTDWEAIESAYRSGTLSIRGIAEKHGINEGTIRNRAKKNGWMRDLGAQVRVAAQSKLLRKSLRTESARKDSEIIDDASDEAAEVVLAHRTGLSEWRSIAAKLSTALSVMDITEDNHDKVARSLNSGVDALLKVIKGEREAYNLNDVEADSAGKSLADLLSEVAPGVE